MKLIRDILLVVLVALLSFFMPAYIEVFKNMDSQTVNDLFKQPAFYLIIIIPIAIVGVLMFFIHKIDDWEKEEENQVQSDIIKELQTNREIEQKRHDELIKAVQNIGGCKFNEIKLDTLINEIRQDRDERNKRR